MADSAVILLSGGLDSATCLAIARAQGRECHCLTISYGQRHEAELSAARAVAERHGAASHKTLHIDLRAFGGSALTSDIPVPKSDEPWSDPAGGAEARGAQGIPVTYVPARNTIFLSYALGLAEVLDARWIYAGLNAVDYSGYPDCRPEFVSAYQRMADLATRAGIEGHGPRIETPLIRLSKRQIIERGLELGVDYGLTLSCYDPVGTDDQWSACGRCDACRIRAAAFAELHRDDPAAAGRTPPVLGAARPRG